MTLEGKKEDGSTYEVPLAHTFNANQLKWFKAGSALNAVRLSLVALTVSWVFLCEAIHRCCAISDLSGVSRFASMHCLMPLLMAFIDVEGVNVPCRCGSRKPFQAQCPVEGDVTICSVVGWAAPSSAVLWLHRQPRILQRGAVGLRLTSSYALR